MLGDAKKGQKKQRMAKRWKNREITVIFAAVLLLFGIFLIVPSVHLLGKSFLGEHGITLAFYREVLREDGFLQVIWNSFRVSSLAAVLTTVIAFLIAYTIHYTKVPQPLKKIMRAVTILPMFLPTITYGFAIIYSFGKEGFLTRLAGRQLFEIYGINGLLLGYVIYTLPVCFMLIFNAMSYIDKKYIVVSRIMGDKPYVTFWITLIRPLLGTLAASFVQSFFLSFTDFGIPAAVGGRYEVLAGVLYDQMLGSVPDFNRGAVVAMLMLVPSIVSILILRFLERYNVRYNKISEIELRKNKFRDIGCGLAGSLVCLGILAVFAVIFLVPFVEEWPYHIGFTLEHIKSVLSDHELSGVYRNSLYVALLTAFAGTLTVYGSALVTARSRLGTKWKNLIEAAAMITNTIPGMVLGLAFLFCFSGTSLQGTFAILVICNVIHFFATPYLMMKESLTKLNASWETTAMLMGDSWIKTIFRVVTPNAMATIIEVFSYYFINAMVTISAVIFLAGARTMVITTKIKQLQYYNKYNEIFVLSLLLLLTNLAFKGIFHCLAQKSGQEEEITDRKAAGKIRKQKIWKRGSAMILAAAVLLVGGSAVAEGGGKELVVIYSNADDEAITAIKKTLDENGFEGAYILQSFGTSELGGKLLAEGKNLEADLITMSTFYIDSAQEEHQMFADLTLSKDTLEKRKPYYAPITKQEGALVINTEVLREQGLPAPQSLADLTDPAYKNLVSVTDISSSSTAWLMIQAVISEYGEDKGAEILSQIYENAGPHIEDSGSGPLKKVRAGEVAVGFGLRHQAVADKENGLPVDYVDPVEGNFSLTESLAVLERETPRKEKAMEMAECLIQNGREEFQKTYPLPIYEGETLVGENASACPKVFPEPLTVELLEEHQEFSERCK